MNHAIEKQKEMAKNILSIYSNKEALTTKEVGVEDFQKSYPQEGFSIITSDILKSYATKAVEDIDKLKDKKEKEDLIKKSADEINSFEKVIVKAENGVSRNFYVKKKESKN